MGIMSFLRNRAGVILVFAIGLAIVAFLLGDFLQVGGPSLATNQNEVGEVAGESIDYNDFNEKVEQNTANFRQQMGGSINPQMTSYIVENTWSQSISEILLRKEVKRLGLEIGKNEINDMISGKNPAPQIVQSFGNPQTGQVDRAQLNKFLSDMESQPASNPIRQQWGNFLVSLKQDRLNQKYLNLVKNSIYVTSLEAREDYIHKNKLADFNYVNLEYSSIPDNQVKPTDSDYKDYYEENKQQFKNQEETRDIQYVVFDANPSTTDSAEVKARVEKLAAEFKASTTDSLFVSINSDTKTPVEYVPKGQLDPGIDSLVFKSSTGSFIGPLFSNGTYKMAKVLDIKNQPDSVKSSHILINPATEGGLDKAKAKADSIANLIRSGASFAELAKKFGTDGTKDKGGDLGFYSYNNPGLDKDYKNAIFNGPVGALKVVTSQYGVHVIRIDAQKGSSQVAKVAVVDKALVSSNKTQQLIYGKATSFLSGLNDGKEFDEKAKKQGLQKINGDNVTATQSSLTAMENAREIVRWAFKAEEGDVSDQVFELENKYVVAKLTEIREQGLLPLEQVKSQIEPMVRTRVKAKMLKEKMENALSGSTNINQVAQKLNKVVVPSQNVVWANPIISGTSQENKVVGTVFGLQPGKLSEPIEGEKGVYIVSVIKFTSPKPLTNTYQQKEQLLNTASQRAQSDAFKALRDNANVKDYRGRFF